MTGDGQFAVSGHLPFQSVAESAFVDSRKSTDVRSLGADPDTRTEVTLEFTYAGQKYRIIRKAAHERLAKKKNKAGLYDTITDGPEAELYWIGPDGQVQTDHSVIQNKDSVTNKVTEILGVDRPQFMQIAMIAQGDFRKLIDGSTRDREELYRTIFQTERYKRLQDEVKRDFIAISDQSKKAIQDIRDQVVNDVRQQEIQQTDTMTDEQIVEMVENAIRSRPNDFPLLTKYYLNAE